MSYAELLGVAVQAARAAGEIHLKHLGRAHVVRSKSSFADLVTEVDGEAERVIRELIAAAYPDHAVLGEEEGLGGQGVDVQALDVQGLDVQGLGASPEYRWVVDPLDGTVNYAHGYPVFCASVGVEERGRRVAGAVFDPSRNELFTASLGGGAFLNGRAIGVSDTPTLTTPALLATGFPYDATDERNVAHLLKLLRLGVPVRRPGAAALDLCNVACGRMDAYWELGLKPWDSAAGSLIVEEAGGQVTDAAGRADPYAEMIVASNGPLHTELLGLLRDAK